MSWLVCLTLLVAAAYSWDLQASQTNVISGLTDNATLRCLYSNRSGPIIKTMLRIRLLKLRNATNTWDVFASLTLPNTSNVVLHLEDSVKKETDLRIASGHLGAPRESFLSIVWSSASEETGGRYVCQVEGFNGDNSEHVQVETHEVAITTSDVTPSALLEILGKIRNDMKELMKDLKSSKNTTSENSPFDVRYWPAGPFALLATNSSSCPDTDQTKMAIGSISHWHYSHVVPKHNTSTGSHIKSPIWGYRRNYYFLNTSFCVKSNQSDQNIMWPKGSYCVNAAPTCPVGFQISVLSFNLVDNLGSTVVSPPFIDQEAGQSTYRFCCRADGNADVPIVLPNSKPFFLYRFGGRCQSVLHTDVTNEWLEIDTDNQNNKWDEYSSPFHPDGRINDVRLELCYYQMRKQSSQSQSNFVPTLD